MDLTVDVHTHMYLRTYMYVYHHVLKTTLDNHDWDRCTYDGVKSDILTQGSSSVIMIAKHIGTPLFICAHMFT